MDLNVIKERLASLNTQQPQSGGGQKKNLFWKPSIGKQTVRIVPSKFRPEFPFTEMMFYYGIGQRVIASPANWKQKDPIMEFAKQLRQSNDRENWRLAKKLDPKTRIFAPVVVRGEEDKGVRLWQFGKLIYEELLSLAVDEEIGDYTDIVNGRDLTIETVGPESTGTNYNKSSVRVRLKQSPLSEDAALVEKWTKEQPDPTKEFKRFTFDEMKTALEKWLSPEEGEEGDIISEPAVEFDGKPEPSKFQLDTSKAKKTKEDKFDSLFDENSQVEDKHDDLPF